MKNKFDGLYKSEIKKINNVARKLTGFNDCRLDYYNYKIINSSYVLVKAKLYHDKFRPDEYVDVYLNVDLTDRRKSKAYGYYKDSYGCDIPQLDVTDNIQVVYDNYDTFTDCNCKTIKELFEGICNGKIPSVLGIEYNYEYGNVFTLDIPNRNVYWNENTINDKNLSFSLIELYFFLKLQCNTKSKK